jgi:hypothetical protein
MFSSAEQQSSHPLQLLVYPLHMGYTNICSVTALPSSLQSGACILQDAEICDRIDSTLEPLLHFRFLAFNSNRVMGLFITSRGFRKYDSLPQLRI